MNSREIDDVVDVVINGLLVRGGFPTAVTGAGRLDALGLTSQDGVEAACDLEAQLGIKIDDAVNPLAHESGSRMRTVAELKTWARRQVAVAGGAR